MPPASAGAEVTTFSNDPVKVPPPVPPPLVPVVNVLEYGRNAAPLRSCTPVGDFEPVLGVGRQAPPSAGGR